MNEMWSMVGREAVPTGGDVEKETDNRDEVAFGWSSVKGVVLFVSDVTKWQGEVVLRPPCSGFSTSSKAVP